MKYIDNENVHDPRVNLAIEEYALRHLPIDDTYLLFYVNEPCIIVGKNQNTAEEINRDYVEENNVHVVRRLSGGGAVYQDKGNLNFSFITKDDGDSFSNFKKFTQPVIDTLKKLGVDAQLSGRNDIHAGDRKISGNAQYTTKGRMFSHGTLLLDSDIEQVVMALNVSDEKIRSKGIKSIRSRVANINEFLDHKMNVDELKKAILEFVFAEGDVETQQLTEEDWEGIHKISKERYQNWDWNYGKNPKFDLHRSKKFDAGLIDIRMNVKGNVITDVKIFGDFFGVGEVADVEDLLKDVRYEEKAIHEALQDLDMTHYFGRVSKEELIELIY
ncbi:lipoate--protein ligase [Salisediminibacterium beveridgei]|uniref:lipoate--protein ligase n=1 Tax=Salisediminibacterium beveridgei TaxID=632773 RepID=A0A1D7QU55_9BACI|nr:lipoate--protein ligase [Salisediminibacterium beveridgei]AOM82541.1 Lipoate-protein ligase A [Salisediminibacterium beveridgei]